MTWTLSELLPVAAHRTKRQAMVDDHFGTVHEGNFTGFSVGELAGFSVVTVTSAAGLVSAINAMAINDKKIFECQWNGLSSTSARPNGPAQASLTANPGVDWGYDRPGWSVHVRPAAGYSPQFQSTYSGNVLYFSGASKIHFKDMVFEASGIRFTRSAGYRPCLAMAALENCTFRNITLATWCVELNDARVCHMDRCKLTNVRKGITGSPNYFRNWNAEIKGLNDDDIHGLRGYTKGYMSAWVANIWLAGIVVYDSGSSYTASGSHGDFLQTETPTETGQHLGYSLLIEMNIAHNNRPANATEFQGIFGSSGSGFFGDYLVHNSIIIGSATWQCQVSDPTDNQDKVVTKNMFLRSANPIAYDVAPAVRGTRVSPGTGSLTVSSNYFGQLGSGGASNVTATGNVIVDPRAAAVSPNRYVDVLTGNGSFGTDANGWLNYASPDAGAADAASAKTAIIGFAKPKAGWAVNAGPSDPALWPVGDFSALSASGGGGGGTGGGGGGGTTPYTLVGNLVPINVAVA